MVAKGVVFLDPCPKCGCPLSVDSRKRYLFCMAGHYSRKLVGVTPYTKFVARSLTAQEASRLKNRHNTASWLRLKKA